MWLAHCRQRQKIGGALTIYRCRILQRFFPVESMAGGIVLALSQAVGALAGELSGQDLAGIAMAR